MFTHINFLALILIATNYCSSTLISVTCYVFNICTKVRMYRIVSANDSKHTSYLALYSYFFYRLYDYKQLSTPHLKI